MKRIFVNGIMTANAIEDVEKRKIIKTFFNNVIHDSNFIFDKRNQCLKDIEAIIELVDEDLGFVAFVRTTGKQKLCYITYNNMTNMLEIDSSNYISMLEIGCLSIAEIKSYNRICDLRKRIRSVIFTTEEVWIFE